LKEGPGSAVEDGESIPVPNGRLRLEGVRGRLEWQATDCVRGLGGLARISNDEELEEPLQFWGAWGK